MESAFPEPGSARLAMGRIRQALQKELDFTAHIQDSPEERGLHAANARDRADAARCDGLPLKPRPLNYV